MTPQVHRVHHLIAPLRRNRDFAAVLSVFDVLFSTGQRPIQDAFSATGPGSVYAALLRIDGAVRHLNFADLCGARTVTLTRHLE